MAVTVQRQFASVVTEMDQDAFIGSSIENGATIIPFDLRTLDFQREVGTTSTISWRQDTYHVDVHELSTVLNPMKYRFILAPGYSLGDDNRRMDFTPHIKGVSPSQPMSHSIIRLAGDLAVVCGVSLRHMALIFSSLCLIPMTKSSSKRWMDDIGSNVPTEEEMRQPLLALKPVTECHRDGDDPMGTDHWVMVVKDAHDRILRTHEGESEPGDEAQQFLKKLTDLGLHVTSAFSDAAASFIGALKSVFPQARLQADHFHTAKHIWGKLKKSLVAYRRKSKSSGEENQDEAVMAWAKK